MARTYRKPSFYVRRSDVEHVNKELGYWYKCPYQTIWVKKTEEEYEHDLRRARKEYERKVAENGGHIDYQAWSWLCKRYETRYIREPWVNRKRRVQIPYMKEKCIADALNERAEMQRDGRWNESSIRSGFKHATARDLRRKNKRLCKRIMDDADYDHKPYPGRKEGKCQIWDWW